MSGGVPQDVEPLTPDELLFSPVRTTQISSTAATISFSANREAKVTVDYGLEIPDYGHTVDAGFVQAEKQTEVQLKNLEPGRRYVVRLRAKWEGAEYLGGDFWLFTNLP